MVNSYGYTPFGQFYGTPDETVDNPWTFTGQWYDEEIAQYYLRARMYDPTMMRFTSRDPVRGERQEPLTLHKYLYCLNDPVDNIDLTGENAMANSLVAPVVVGNAAHAFAVTAVAYGVSTMDWSYIDLGITVDMNISKIISMAMIGIMPTSSIESIVHAKGGRRKNEDAGSRAFYEMQQRMDNRMSGKEPPKGFWAKVLFYSAQLVNEFSGWLK